MLTEPMQPCAYPTCPAVVVAGYCPVHRVLAVRPNADVRRWYHTARWQRLRRLVLQEEPLCRRCQARGETVASRAADHVQPHAGDAGKFWSRSNLQGLCLPCHGQKTRRGQ